MHHPFDFHQHDQSDHLLSSRLIVLTGAGISAPSGLSTFRSADGIWNRFSLERVCNLTHYTSKALDPEERQYIFSFYQQLAHEVARAIPNEAHRLLARWNQMLGSRMTIFTSNVDRLHQKAGAITTMELHGNLFNMECLDCSAVWPAPNVNGAPHYDPHGSCPTCSSRLIKPAVVFFGQSAPNYTHLDRFLSTKKRRSDDALLVIGTSLEVIDVYQLLPTAGHFGSAPPKSIYVNAEATYASGHFDHFIQGSAHTHLSQAAPILSQILKVDLPSYIDGADDGFGDQLF